MMDATLITGTLAIIGALYALSAKHLMRGVLGLALFFASLAGMFAQLGAWYLAVGQLILFVGGVVTLFVLAFNFTKTPLQTDKGIVGLLLMFAVLLVLALFIPALPQTQSIGLSEFGTLFFTQYGWIVNVALLIGFSALLGAQYLMEDA